MSTFREAIAHARAGGTSKCEGKTVRFLTFEEAKSIIFERSPSRAVRRDEKGKAVVENGQIVVDEFADPSYRVKNLGLYDVGGAEPTQFCPSEEDFVAEWLCQSEEEPSEQPAAAEESEAIQPEAIPPEAVDAALEEIDGNDIDDASDDNEIDDDDDDIDAIDDETR